MSFFAEIKRKVAVAYVMFRLYRVARMAHIPFWAFCRLLLGKWWKRRTARWR